MSTGPTKDVRYRPGGGKDRIDIEDWLATEPAEQFEASYMYWAYK
jgi:hypothetical protein